MEDNDKKQEDFQSVPPKDVFKALREEEEKTQGKNPTEPLDKEKLELEIEMLDDNIKTYVDILRSRSKLLNDVCTTILAREHTKETAPPELSRDLLYQEMTQLEEFFSWLVDSGYLTDQNEMLCHVERISSLIELPDETVPVVDPKTEVLTMSLKHVYVDYKRKQKKYAMAHMIISDRESKDLVRVIKMSHDKIHGEIDELVLSSVEEKKGREKHIAGLYKILHSSYDKLTKRIIGFLLSGSKTSKDERQDVFYEKLSFKCRFISRVITSKDYEILQMKHDIPCFIYQDYNGTLESLLTYLLYEADETLFKKWDHDYMLKIEELEKGLDLEKFNDITAPQTLN